MHRIEETIDRGLCIGCGACAVATDGAVALTLGPTRLYQADITDASADDVRAASRVCPFSDESPNEDELGAPHGDDLMARDQYLGHYSRTFAGRVADDDYVVGSSSGGLTSWLATRLIETGEVDAVICVGRSGPTAESLFEYGELSAQEVSANRKSQYYATTMAEALAVIERSDSRYALIGVPCFIRAARALCIERTDLAARLPVLIALVCGHYKTQGFAESLAWQLGVPPDRLADVDFRVKRADRGANDYDFAARDAMGGDWQSRPVRELVGGNWGHSAFQPEACNFCDDVVGETADVSFGDAWLPRFTSDSRGTNVVVSRNRMIDGLFDEGADGHRIDVYPLSAGEAFASQAGGFRNRREGLSLRLADDSAAGLSVPRKRVLPDGNAVDSRRARLLRQRRRMAALSHASFNDAMAAGDLDIYLRRQRREMGRYRRIENGPARRLYLGCRRSIGTVLRRLGLR